MVSGWTSGAVRAFRAGRRAVGLRGYEALMPEDAVGPRAADDIASHGWRCGSLPPLELTPPADWDIETSFDRNVAFRLHAWEPLGPAFGAMGSPGKRARTTFVLAVALDWIEQHPKRSSRAGFAWYDMAVGLRAYRLGFLLDATSRDRTIDDDAIATLLDSAEQHRLALSDEKSFAAHSNHGFFQGAGLLALATRFPELPGMEEAADVADRRFRAMVDAQFLSDGMHAEHSPGYHALVLGALGAVIDAGLAPGGDLAAVRRRAEEALSSFVLPDGSWASIGDTDAWPEPPVAAPVPAPAEDPLRAYPESGYLVVRAPASTYLAQTCAFHSRAHKHADDLSFVWYDRGHQLLIDPGRFGYLDPTKRGSALSRQGFWYADPRRVYVESTRAHNTIEIDGRSNDRRGRPYGSALARWGCTDEIYFSEATVRHRKSIIHTRLLLLRPAEWLIVFDNLVDNRKAPHDFEQRLHFAPDVELDAADGRLSAIVGGEAEALHVCALLEADPVAPERGQRSPVLLGWHSPRERALGPTWTTAYRIEKRPHHTFATLLCFGSEAVEADGAASRSNITGRRARLVWSGGGVRHQIDLDREAAEIEISYRTNVT